MIAKAPQHAQDTAETLKSKEASTDPQKPESAKEASHEGGGHGGGNEQGTSSGGGNEQDTSGGGGNEEEQPKKASAPSQPWPVRLFNGVARGKRCHIVPVLICKARAHPLPKHLTQKCKAPAHPPPKHLTQKRKAPAHPPPKHLTQKRKLENTSEV